MTSEMNSAIREILQPMYLKLLTQMFMYWTFVDFFRVGMHNKTFKNGVSESSKTTEIDYHVTFIRLTLSNWHHFMSRSSTAPFWNFVYPDKKFFSKNFRLSLLSYQKEQVFFWIRLLFLRELYFLDILKENWISYGQFHVKFQLHTSRPT